MRVEFSEIALAGIRRELPDPSRQQSCFASLTFYLRRDHHLHSERCAAFDDVATFIYIFGGRRRVIYEIGHDCVVIWSFTPRT